MLRKLAIALVALAAVGGAVAPTTASAQWRGRGGWGRGWGGRGFYGRGWGYRGGYYPAYGYGAYGGCWRSVRYWGPYGPVWRRVWVC